MRLRITKRFYYAKRNRFFNPGDVIDVPDEDAVIWVRHEMAMQDKTIDVPRETKAAPVQSVAEPVKIVEIPKPVTTKRKPAKRGKK